MDLLVVNDWRRMLRYDPIERLLCSNHEAVRFFTKRDLLSKKSASSSLWELKEPQSIIRKQLRDGSWKYPGRYPEKYPDVNYSLIETFKRLQVLVHKYGFNKSHPVIRDGCEYMISCQTPEGDIRGVYASQYHPHYQGIFTELLVEAGYGDDSRVHKGIKWILSVRVSDGGWASPMLDEGISWEEQGDLSSKHGPVIPFNPSMHWCNMATGMSLRALACHPEYRYGDGARRAGELLSSRFFKPNIYNTYKAADNWVRFQYPFWWNNLLMALDSLSLIGFELDHPRVDEAVRWFIDHQREDGLWNDNYKRNAKNVDTKRGIESREWVTIAFCRLLKRFS